MKTEDKIRYFYDNVKINGICASEKMQKFPISVALPAAAVISVAIGAAVIIPAIIKKSASSKTLKNPA
ncbi:MAG: hypothetical protein KBS59_02985 [Clostridiales bacterium]|nr:hypothetical protein [Clostridiales bacterium]